MSWERAINKPRGKMTSYAFFVQSCREEHKKKHPDENFVFSDFIKKCSMKWKTIPKKEKQRFIEMSEHDKQRYEIEMQSYKPKYKKVKQCKKHVKDPNAPKRTMSDFLWFSNDQRANIKANNPEYTQVDIAKELGRRWAAADLETRTKYQQLFEQDKMRYEKAMMEYRKTTGQQQLKYETYDVKVEFDYKEE